jgi:hypothetical protein
VASEHKEIEQLCDSIATRLKDAGITDAMLQATLPEVREQLVRDGYPELFADEKKTRRKTGTPGRKRKIKNKKEPK